MSKTLFFSGPNMSMVKFRITQKWAKMNMEAEVKNRVAKFGGGGGDENRGVAEGGKSGLGAAESGFGAGTGDIRGRRSWVQD